MISEHSAHLTPLSVDFRTWLWRYTYLLLLISMLWHTQELYKSKGDKLCSSAECRIWTRVLRHQIASRLNARWQTDWVIEDQAKHLELDSPSLWSASIQPTWPHCQLTFAPGSGDIHICYCLFRCSGTGKRYSNRKETSCVPLLNEGFEPGVSDTKLPADWMLADKPTELSRIMLKILNSTARPDDQRAFSPLTPLSVDFRTWLWRCTYLLLLISMLWHRQALFKSKGDKLCSSAECRIWTWGLRHQIARGLNARLLTDWAIEDQAKNLNSTARPYDQRVFSPLDPTVSWLSHLALAIYLFVVVNFDALAQARVI